MSENSKQVLAERMIHVRALAQSSLARFSRLEPGDCKEVYLFHKDQFCGVRFTLGAFRADWRIDDTAYTVHRGDDLLDRIEMQPDQGQRAA